MTLRALIVGLCALVLVTQATAATVKDRASETPRSQKTQTRTRASAPQTLEQRHTFQLNAVRKHRGTVRFFESRPWIFRSKRHGPRARAAKRVAEQRLARAERNVTALRRAMERRDARRLASLPPKAAICTVFGPHCRQALAVAWCESRFDPEARNGQYLGLFQMGNYARTRFGHGPTPHAQSQAAHAYFVESGRTWGPWSCKPWHAYS
jgi:hypothetical protein